MSQSLHQSGDGFFGGGHFTEYLALAGRIGDVLSGLEPPQHRPHVVDPRADLANHRGDRVDHARRQAAHPDLPSEQPPRHLRDFLNAHRPVPADVDALAVHAWHVRGVSKVVSDILGEDERERDGRRAEPHDPPLGERIPSIWMIESRKAPGRSETNGTPFSSSRSSASFLFQKCGTSGVWSLVRMLISTKRRTPVWLATSIMLRLPTVSIIAVSPLLWRVYPAAVVITASAPS